MDLVFNALIFIITAVLVVRLFFRGWDKTKEAFRFFTQQSNAFCGAAALLMCIAPGAQWAWTIKYVATVAVTVTMLTVFLFLGPSIGSYKPLLSGSVFFMHLLTPMMALVSFVFFEKRGMGFSTALLGMLPVVLYGSWYLYKVVLSPEDRRWKDFYGFNKNGKWPISFAAMMVGAFAVCMVFMVLQNI